MGDITPANLQAGMISVWCKACRSSPVARLLDVAAAATAATAAAAADRLAGMPPRSLEFRTRLYALAS